jgi:hypothetical protein
MLDICHPHISSYHLLILTLSQLKRKLITANHILHSKEIVDAYGHISIRHPNNPAIYLICGYTAPALVASSDDLIEYWVKGNP